MRIKNIFLKNIGNLIIILNEQNKFQNLYQSLYYFIRDLIIFNGISAIQCSITNFYYPFLIKKIASFFAKFHLVKHWITYF